MRFLHNWSFATARVTAPVGCRDVLNKKAVPGGSEIDLALGRPRPRRGPSPGA